MPGVEDKVAFGRGGTYDSIVAANSAWSGGQRVGGAQNSTASLHGVTAFPDHGADGSAAHVCTHIVSAVLVYRHHRHF